MKTTTGRTPWHLSVVDFILHLGYSCPWLFERGDPCFFLYFWNQNLNPHSPTTTTKPTLIPYSFDMTHDPTLPLNLANFHSSFLSFQIFPLRHRVFPFLFEKERGREREINGRDRWKEGEREILFSWQKKKRTFFILRFFFFLVSSKRKRKKQPFLPSSFLIPTMIPQILITAPAFIPHPSFSFFLSFPRCFFHSSLFLPPFRSL